MRIGFDATVLAAGTRYTGTGQYAENLVRVLPLLAPEDHFVLYGSPPQDLFPRIPANVTWHPMRRLPFGRVSALAGHMIVLPRMTRKDRIDVLHVPGVHTRASLPPVPRGLPCPLVVTIHDLIPMTYYAKTETPLPWRLSTFYRWNLKSAVKAQHIITVSNASRKDIIETLGLPPERITTVHNGVNPAWRPKCGGVTWKGPTNGAPYMLFGGSFEPRKNLRRLLHAFQRAVDSGLRHHLLMVVDGDTPHAAQLRELARTLPCTDRLHFLTDLEESSLRSVYQHADAFVFPTLSEGFGLPPLQALGCGLPVIASDLPVMREVLGEAAEYFDPNSVEDMANALVRAASDRALRDRLRLAGPLQASRFTWEAAGEATLDVYRSVISKRTSL